MWKCKPRWFISLPPPNCQTEMLFLSRSFPMVFEALEPLRRKGYLTTYNTQTEKLDSSAITVIVTCHSNVLGLVQALETRDMFMDAPLLDIANPSFTPSISPTAHMSFLRHFGNTWLIGNHRERLRKVVDVAHEKGIMVRIWGVPNSPQWLRWVLHITIA